MVAATALKMIASSHLQWLDLPTEFHKDLPTGSEVDMGGVRNIDGQIVW
jgi:hypothetical protein